MKRSPGRIRLLEGLLALLGAAVVSMFVWPSVWFEGRQSYSTEALSRHEPWSLQLPGGPPIHNPELGDLDLYFFPQIARVTRILHEEGRLPLWNDAAFGGAPGIGNVQVPLLSPFLLGLPLFQPRDEGFSLFAVARGLSWMAILRFVLCLAGAYLWLRLLPSGPWTAALGALVCAAGPYASLWRHSTPEMVFSLVPPALWAFEACLAARRRGGGGGGFAVLGGLFLALSHHGGYPQTSIPLTAFVLFYFVFLRTVRGERRRLLFPIFLGVGASLLLALPSWLPFLFYLTQGKVGTYRSAEGLLPPGASGATVLGTTLLAAVLAGSAFGLVTRLRRPRCLRPLGIGLLLGAALGLAQWGGGIDLGLARLLPGLQARPWEGGGARGGPPLIEVAQGAFGILPALLLLSGVGRAAGRLRVLGILVLLVSGGFPIFHAGLRFVLPLLEPSRLACLVPLCAALALTLSGASLAAAERAVRLRRLRGSGLGLLGFVAALALFPGQLRDGFAALGPGAWAAGAVLAAVLLLPGRLLLVRRGLAPLWLLLGALQLPLLAWNAQPSLGPERTYPTTPFLEELARVVRARPGNRVFTCDFGVFPGNSLLAFGLPSVLAYDGVEPARFQDVLQYLPREGPGLPRKEWRAASLRLDSHLFDLLGGRVVVARAGTKWPDHFREIRKEPLALALNPRAVGEAWLVDEAYDLSEDPWALLQRPPRKALGLEEAPDPEEAGPPSGATGPPGDLRFLRREREGRLLEIRARRPCWLVLRLPPDPDWEAVLDGRPVLLRPAFHLWSCLRLEAGTHRLSLTYRPLGFRVGLLGALLGFLVLAATWILGRGRGRPAG